VFQSQSLEVEARHWVRAEELLQLTLRFCQLARELLLRLAEGLQRLG
jgi:hypothetical protein